MTDFTQDTWEIDDMSIAGFIMLQSNRGEHGMSLLKVKRSESPGKNRFTYVFNDPKGHGELLKIEYMNSDFREYSSIIQGLKKMCFDGRPKQRRSSRKAVGRSR